ncbi:hypothetical protein GGI22_005710, partial [Coemansia erecta]
MCHYSPLATPRRRAGKRARTVRDPDSAANASQTAVGNASNESMDRASRGEPLVLSSSVRALSGNSVATTNGEHAVSDITDTAGPSGQVEPSTGSSENRQWQPEAIELRRDINSLSHKFDSISAKLDSLIKLVGKQRRNSTYNSDAEYGSSEEGSASYESDNHHGSDRVAENGSRYGGVYRDYNNLIDKTSRFNIDASNAVSISEAMREIDRQHNEQQIPGGDVHVSASLHSPRQTNGDGSSGVHGASNAL